MKLAAIGFLAAVIALGQRGPSMGRGGGVLYPGTRAPRGSGGRFLTPPPPAHPAHGYGVLVPIPVYYGAGYYGYDPSIPIGAQSAPAYDADAASYASPTQSPVVVINQSYGQDYQDAEPPPEPTIHTFDATTSVTREPQPTIYLIAMKDHTIVAAIGYWVEGDTLNYMTQDGNQNQVSMALVDRDFSKQLNDDRHVDFRLPKQN